MATTKSTSRLYCVTVSYNLECEDAAKAIDKVLGCSPVVPMAISAEPVSTYEDDDDD